MNKITEHSQFIFPVALSTSNKTRVFHKCTKILKRKSPSCYDNSTIFFYIIRTSPPSKFNFKSLEICFVFHNFYKPLKKLKVTFLHNNKFLSSHSIKSEHHLNYRIYVYTLFDKILQTKNINYFSKFSYKTAKTICKSICVWK